MAHHDTSALGALVGHDDNGGVLIKADVGAVVTAQAVLATDDDGLDHVALLHGTTGSSLLDAANHDVTDVCVSLAGTAQYTEAHSLLSTGIVGHFEISLHLNHLSGPPFKVPG